VTALVWLSPHARNLSSALQPIWPTTSEARLYLHPPWCVRRFAKNLKATSGGEDLDPEALMSFLYTLTDGAEIKGYLSEFLGLSDGVGKFADEFITRKAFDAK
jgi:hypothetical protein